ncbi:hypothetical protein PPYR_13455 [Photinus pyralis]|uniref:Uncharacterized protein n=1 Tax=Photinus pyralis TaxID=7054 RepID=A0A5N4A935_PHOPY|nr:uncharacterized protein LOC116179039 [Photinus pyralis]KAB0793835.1 hypothetical protein PPYR_13455 [Photinus pyralis]
MVTVILVAVAIAIAFHHTSGFHFEDHPDHFRDSPAQYFDENSDIVGGVLTHAHLHALKKQAKLRRFAKRAKLKSHLLFPLLLSPTPQEFVDDDIIYEEHSDGEPHPNDEHHTDYASPGPYQGDTPVSAWSDGPYYDYFRDAEPTHHTKKLFHGNPHGYPVVFHNYGPPPHLHEDFSSHSESQQFYHPPSHNAPHPHPNSNKQNTLILVPSTGGTFQISQVAGNNNGITQSQAARAVHETLLAPNPSLVAPSTFPLRGNREYWRAAAEPDQDNVGPSKRNKRQLNEYFYGFNPFQQAPCPHQAGYDPIVGAPNVVSVSRNRKIWQIPGPDEADISVVIKRSANKRKKRSLPFLRLLLDPNAQIDVPKTFARMGAIARHSVESKHQPVYHVTNAIGSVRDMFMSTLRVPPQDLFVPSQYSIVEKKHDSRRAVPNESDVYNKLGGMLRDSIRSAEDVAVHAGDFLHSARKVVSTSKHVVPRLVVSSLRVPAFQHKLHLPIVLTSRSHHENAEARHHSETDPNFVGVNHVMETLGIGRKDSRHAEDISETLEALDGAQRAVGARSLKEFLTHLKNTKPHGLKRSVDESTGQKPVLLQGVTRVFLANPDADLEMRDKRQVGEPFLGAINPEMFQRLFNASLDSVRQKISPPFHDGHLDEEDVDHRVGIGMEMGGALIEPFMGKLDMDEIYAYPYEDSYDDEYEYW